MFDDRKDAGRQLAKALEKYKDKDVLVLGIPRGGVEVGYEIAKHLDADFSIVVSRKLPYPGNPEFGFGAIAEDGSMFILKEYVEQLPEETVERIIKQQKAEIKRRIAALRLNMPLPEIKGRTVILVDDGIAMGSTMRAAIELCRNKKAAKVVVAAGVSAPDTERQMKRIADDAVILEKPAFFQAVAQAYRNWYDVPDDEVIEIFKKWQR